MKRNGRNGLEPLSFNGVALHSIKHMPQDARAVRFVMCLLQQTEFPKRETLEPEEMVEHFKRVWRRGKKRILPQASKLRVEAFSREGEGFQLVVLLIRFKHRPHSDHQDQVVGVCGTPHGYLWRARKLNGSGVTA